jgi:hypothetical protein
MGSAGRTPTPVECWECYGSGACPECRGAGEMPRLVGKTTAHEVHTWQQPGDPSGHQVTEVRQVACSRCRQTGVCAHCGGAGVTVERPPQPDRLSKLRRALRAWLGPR